MFARLRSQSVSRLFLMVMVIVALLPVLVLGYHLYQTAWQDSWREIREKHQLLAQNLAAPITMYINDHRNILSLLAESLFIKNKINSTHAGHLLTRVTRKVDGFAQLILLDMQGRILAYSENAGEQVKSAQVFANEQCYLMTRERHDWTISRVKRHPLTGKPSIFMGYPLINKQGQHVGVLLAELRIDYIEKIRRNVKFGKQGHSAIVDQTGHVVAHPNPAWMDEIRDLSSWPIVQSMLAGKTGVTRFYSPFIKENMVAGYAAVPGIGWGIMVPQPESEVVEQVDQLMHSYLIWGVMGLLLAILLAILIAKWVTRPMNKLASDSYDLMHNGMVGNIPPVQLDAPEEIRQLGNVFQALIGSLQQSRDEVVSLNDSLQEKVAEATRQLRETNFQLEITARTDHLTNLANRRYFETSLSRTLNRRSTDVDQVCVLLIDVDHFKKINDSYHHAAGDKVLTHVAEILAGSMRQGDLVARYGGDEFAAYMRCTQDVGLQRAEEIRRIIEQSEIYWQNKAIRITVSIGMYCLNLESDIDVDDLLENADKAMYEAKLRGRNCVVDRKS